MARTDLASLQQLCDCLEALCRQPLVGVREIGNHPNSRDITVARKQGIIDQP